MVSGHERGIGGGNLIAMHAVTEPDQDRKGGNGGVGGGLRGLALVRQTGDSFSYLSETRDICLRADNGIDELSAFPGFSVFKEFDAAQL